MSLWVLNTSLDLISVPVASSSKKDVAVDTVFIQGRSKARLQEGLVVEKNFLARNPAIKVKSDSPKSSAGASSSSSKDAPEQKAPVVEDKHVKSFKKSENHPNV